MIELRARTLLTPDREIRPGALAIDDDGRVRDLGSVDEATGAEGVLIPGLVDLQCNGAAGADLATAEADAFDHVGAALLAAGVTSWCPTLPSAPAERYPAFLDAAAEARLRRGPRILGVHLEGPFLNPERVGAHDPGHLRAPDPDWLEPLLDRHPDLVRIVTLAPELPGALDVIALCVERGVTVALGHTDADDEQTVAAVEAGAFLLTHLFNAMRPLHHRDVGVVGAALADGRVRSSLIADGRHVHPIVAGLFAQALGPQRTILVSDAVAAPQEEPLTGGFELLDGCVANLTSWGVAFGDALRMATATPAEALGISGLGRLEPGAWGDVVRWEDGRVTEVFLGGERV